MYPVAVVLLTVAHAMASLAFGWWTVFVVGGVWASIVRASDRPVRLAAAGATVGCAGLLAATGADGPVANAFQVVLVGALPSGCQTQLIAEVASNVAEAIGAADENKSRDGVCARQRRAAFSD